MEFVVNYTDGGQRAFHAEDAEQARTIAESFAVERGGLEIASVEPFEPPVEQPPEKGADGDAAGGDEGKTESKSPPEKRPASKQ